MIMTKKNCIYVLQKFQYDLYINFRQIVRYMSGQLDDRLPVFCCKNFATLLVSDRNFQFRCQCICL